MNLSAFDLNLLRVFDALMREGSTVRAGKRIGLSQPAVSAALGRLRHALGDPLFVRRGNGLMPTEFALSLDAPVADMLAGLEIVLAGPRFDPRHATDIFRISGIDFFAELLFPPLVRTIAREAPHMRLQHLALVPDDYMDMLEQHHISLALLPETETPDWVDSQTLFHAPFTVIACRDHPRLARKGVAPGDVIPLDLFCDLGHALCSPDGNLAAMGDAALAEVGRQRRVVATSAFFSGVARLVSASDLIALVPAQLAEALAPRLGLVTYRAPMPLPVPLISMHWHRRSTGAPAHAWLRSRVAEILAPLNPPEMALPA